MRFDPVSRTFILDPFGGECSRCWGTGKVPDDPIPCGPCNGTGRGPKGGRGGCRKCNGSGKDYAPRKPCPEPHADHAHAQPERFDAYIPKAVWAEFLAATPVRMIRQDRGATFAESLFGGGGLYTCLDYGDAFKRSDSETIGAFRARTDSVQLCKVARKTDDPLTLRAADAIVILATRGGYTPLPDFDGDSAQKAETEARGLGYAEGMALGSRLAAAGLNGTMIAATLRR